ncbi:MAG: hypothetical protein GAK30_01300 [Paracidovorax wautersii]|uniref:NrtR DNA-binding winged helix domain-containing protein n=1 Tax=Paracidovorax wautersii TaxID=1177982 RepID=A0A7V8FQ13_9BURK|nr:MAG: hypothetical protein GAK30_01300 [Paracidovorax wautersii]
MRSRIATTPPAPAGAVAIAGLAGASERPLHHRLPLTSPTSRPAAPPASPVDAGRAAIAAELVAVLVAVTQGQARILTTQDGQALPSGAFGTQHRSLQAGMRAWVESETHHPIGYIEQLYTFADRDRAAADERAISVTYLGLTREDARAASSPASASSAQWRDWYHYFPWEDQRQARARERLVQHIVPALLAWRDAAHDAAVAQHRRLRVDTAFDLQSAGWNEDFVLQRYELLYEAGLVAESLRTRAQPPLPTVAALTGQPMQQDFRRILATGIARLRAKIKYRPVVFELMPDTFTLLQLQQSVEVLAGRGLHKQNFRRLVEQQALVEETGAMTSGTSGRPAKLFRFRNDVLLERAISGSKLPVSP